MKFKIFKNVSVHISLPLRFHVEKEDQLLLKFNTQSKYDVPSLQNPYQLRTYQDKDKEQMISLLKKCNLITKDKEFLSALETCLPNGCFLIEEEGKIISTMMARHINTFKEFSGRIDWLATCPEKEGRGLGKICAFEATKRLYRAGYEDIWVTTDDHRIGALKIFTSIGFEPYITQSNKRRWNNLEKILN